MCERNANSFCGHCCNIMGPNDSAPPSGHICFQDIAKQHDLAEWLWVPITNVGENDMRVILGSIGYPFLMVRQWDFLGDEGLATVHRDVAGTITEMYAQDREWGPWTFWDSLYLSTIAFQNEDDLLYCKLIGTF